MEYSGAVEEMCTHKSTICNFLPRGCNCVFLVLTSSPLDGQVDVLILANHLDELSALNWHIPWGIAYMQQSHNR